MKIIFGAVDRLSRICGYAMMVVFLILVCDMMYEVVSRRIFNAPTLWAYDVAYMSNAAFFMVAVFGGFASGNLVPLQQDGVRARGGDLA